MDRLKFPSPYGVMVFQTWNGKGFYPVQCVSVPLRGDGVPNPMASEPLKILGCGAHLRGKTVFSPQIHFLTSKKSVFPSIYKARGKISQEWCYAPFVSILLSLHVLLIILAFIHSNNQPTSSLCKHYNYTTFSIFLPPVLLFIRCFSSLRRIYVQLNGEEL